MNSGLPVIIGGDTNIDTMAQLQTVVGRLGLEIVSDTETKTHCWHTTMIDRRI